MAHKRRRNDSQDPSFDSYSGVIADTSVEDRTRQNTPSNKGMKERAIGGFIDGEAPPT